MNNLQDQVVYLAGPLSNDIKDVQEWNVIFACNAAAGLRATGVTIISPHEMCLHNPESLEYDGWIDHGLDLLLRCDALVLLPGWQASRGCRVEYEHAVEWDIPVYEYSGLECRRYDP